MLEPSVTVLAPESEAHDLVARAVQGGLHLLDLHGASRETRADIASAVCVVRDKYVTAGRDGWTAPVPFDEFISTMDDLLAVLV